MYQKQLNTSPYDGKCEVCQNPIVCEDGPYCHDCEYDLYDLELDRILDEQERQDFERADEYV